MVKMQFVHYSCLIFVATFTLSKAIEDKSAEESPCLNISNAVDPDATWFSSVEKWYYPLASRLDLYRSAHDLLETDYKNIAEYSLYYDSCLEWGINAEGFTLNGYNGKTRHLRTTTVGQGIADFKSEWSQGMVGRAYTTLTDNKTFAFTAACFSDNQMSWNVFATTKTLDEATKNQIFEHAKSLGYNPEYFTEIRYDSCKSKSEITPTTAGQTDLKNEAMSSSENEISDTTTVKSSKSELENDSFCASCKRMCPNILAKTEYMHKYYKKLRKHLGSSD